LEPHSLKPKVRTNRIGTRRNGKSYLGPGGFAREGSLGRVRSGGFARGGFARGGFAREGSL
ncbi:MAG TPA: hypothetical protein VNO24_17515, partial [Blastocatellia bacterium]|nr:hypothetical protein [Blastocatellia bacterium]